MSLGQPRDATRLLSPPDLSFRVVSTEYGADCTFAADGPWFDNEKFIRGWTWSWYQNTTATSLVTPNKTTSDYITHVCNYSVAPEATDSLSHSLFQVLPSGPPHAVLASNNRVDVGNRSVMYVSNATATYQAFARIGAPAAGNYKFGAIAP